MAFEYTPPKYAQMIAELQAGSSPASTRPDRCSQRAPALVRVRDRPAHSGPGAARAAPGRLDRHPAGQGQLRARSPGTGWGQRRAARPGGARPGRVTRAGRADFRRMSPAPARIAALLNIEPGTELVSRRRLVRQDDGEASEIVTWWLPSGLAERAGLGGPEPVRGGIRSLLTGPRASVSITWSSRSLPAAPSRMRRSCSASRGQPGARAVRERPRRPAIRCSRWTWQWQVTCTSWRTHTPSASQAKPATPGRLTNQASKLYS